VGLDDRLELIPEEGLHVLQNGKLYANARRCPWMNDTICTRVCVDDILLLVSPNDVTTEATLVARPDSDKSISLDRERLALFMKEVWRVPLATSWPIPQRR
jgi:hypothetical protein